MLKIMLIFLILAHCGLLGWDSEDNHIWCSGQRKVAGMCYCVTLVLITISHHHPFLLLLFLLRHSEKSCWPGKACLRRSWNLPRRKILTKTPVIPYCIPSLGRDRGEQILMSDKSESAEAQDVKCQVNCLLKRYQLKSSHQTGCQSYRFIISLFSSVFCCSPIPYMNLNIWFYF